MEQISSKEITFRVRRSTWEAARAAARRHETTVAGFVRRVLLEALKRETAGGDNIASASQK
jgi:hypothetical protein